jgi:hypothetical protein
MTIRNSLRLPNFFKWTVSQVFSPPVFSEKKPFGPQVLPLSHFENDFELAEIFEFKDNPPVGSPAGNQLFSSYQMRFKAWMVYIPSLVVLPHGF